MNITKEAKLKVLRLISKADGIQIIRNLGFDEEQILYVIQILEMEGFISLNENKIDLTPKGNSELIKRIPQWIKAENKSKISKIDKNSIYLPNKDEFFF